MSKTVTKTGINQGLIDRLQGKDNDEGGLILDAYNQLSAKGGSKTAGVAKLTKEQQSALARLNGNKNTQALEGQIANAQKGMGTGTGVLSDIATGKQRGATTGSVAQGAQQLANSAPIQAQIDAMNSVSDTNRQEMADQVNRQLNEQALPSIYRGAEASGGTGSSRSAIAEGIARRGAAESIAKGNTNIANQNAAAQAQLRGNAFNTGLNVAMQTQQADIARRQNAASQVAQFGLDSGKAGSAIDQQHLDNYFKGGALTQGQNQNVRNDNAQQAEMDRTQKMKDVMGFEGMIGGLRGGVDTSSSTTPSAMKGSDYFNTLAPVGLAAVMGSDAVKDKVASWF